MKTHLQEHFLCIPRSDLASSNFARDNSQWDEVSRCCSANVFVIQCRGRARCSEPDFRSGHLPLVIFRVALITRIGRFMNHANDAFVFHRAKIRAHHVVARHVDHAAARKRADWQQLKHRNDGNGCKFPGQKNNVLISSSKERAEKADVGRQRSDVGKVGKMPSGRYIRARKDFEKIRQENRVMKGIFVMNVRTLPILAIAGLLSTLAVSQGSEPVAPQTLMSKLKWRCVGPYIGGRVVTVTGVPGNNNLFYAGTVGGGVWKSTDGAEWENISDGKLPGPAPAPAR